MSESPHIKMNRKTIRAVTDSGIYEVVLTSINFKQEHYPS